MHLRDTLMICLLLVLLFFEPCWLFAAEISLQPIPTRLVELLQSHDLDACPDALREARLKLASLSSGDLVRPLCECKGRNLISLMARNPHCPLLSEVIEKFPQASWDAVDLYGWNPLMYALTSDHPQAAKLINRKSAEVVSPEGFTPLMFAARSQQELTAELLLDLGVDALGVKTKQGPALLFHLRQQRGEYLAQLLERQGYEPIEKMLSLLDAGSAAPLLRLGAQFDAEFFARVRAYLESHDGDFHRLLHERNKGDLSAFLLLVSNQVQLLDSAILAAIPDRELNLPPKSERNVYFALAQFAPRHLPSVVSRLSDDEYLELLTYIAPNGQSLCMLLFTHEDQSPFEAGVDKIPADHVYWGRLLSKRPKECPDAVWEKLITRVRKLLGSTLNVLLPQAAVLVHDAIVMKVFGDSLRDLETIKRNSLRGIYHLKQVYTRELAKVDQSSKRCCQICDEQKPVGGFMNFYALSHRHICRSCFENFRRLSGQLDKLPLTGKESFSNHRTQDLRTEDFFASGYSVDETIAAEIAQMRHKMRSIPGWRECPTPACFNGIVFDPNSPSSHCLVCDKTHCFECGKNHGGTCQAYEDSRKATEEMLHKIDSIRTCPRKECGALIEKTQGCNGMQCRCGFKFHWNEGAVERVSHDYSKGVRQYPVNVNGL